MISDALQPTIWDEQLVKECIFTAFKKSRLKRFIIDKFAIYFLSLCAMAGLFFLFNILFHLISQGCSAINGNFLTHLPKPVGETGGGMANAIVGTLILLGLAVSLGVPVGLGTGIYLSEYAEQRFAQIIRFTIDVMNGIPSIVFGIFAYTVFVLPFKPKNFS